MRRSVWLVVGLLVPIAARAGGNPLPAIHADHWAEARAAVRGAADPVAEKLVTYYRLLAPGAASADEIATFIAANPDWPNQAVLQRRRQEAIAAETDPAAARTACADRPITLPAALARCAAAEADAGEADTAAADARAAWRDGLADPLIKPFLARFAPALTPADEWARFDHLAWSTPTAAAAQISRLTPAHRPAARARLALIQGAPDALAQVQALPEGEMSPVLVLDQTRALRRAHRDADALALWQAHGFAAEAAEPDHRRTFWLERSILARALLEDGNADGAYAMADDREQPSSADAAEAAFLAGYIALRRLHDPARATEQFRRLGANSRAVITQARAHYWLGRAQEAAGDDPRPAFRVAAALPTTFYGQIAARALGEDPLVRARAAHDPVFTEAQAWRFTGHELVRAAAALLAWGEPGRARAFLLRMAEVAPDPASLALCARLALAMGMPDTAVFVARRAGIDGTMLPDSGWPEAVVPPPGPVDPAVVLAVIRQESSFDHGVTSPAGARGLMQLMPATARQVAGAPVDSAALGDPARNMRLGEAFLDGLRQKFAGSLPLVVAAYNAGPRKVNDWLAANGDPRTGVIGMIDWIELIDYGETRNYVQRVLENVVMYCARRDEPDGTLIAQWMPPAATGRE